MKILALNSGSSSLKFKLFETEGNSILAKGVAERIGLEKGRVEYESKYQGNKKIYDMEVSNHRSVLSFFLMELDKQLGLSKPTPLKIEAVGHRVVHGGDRFTGAVLVDESVLQAVEACSPMAPLHNPSNLAGIRASMEALPNVPNVAVFDTAFHQTMDPWAYIFPLPYEYYSKMGIRRYGFHGTSHKYVMEKAAEFMGKPLDGINLITCHLGNGSSITAIENGKSIATSLGFGTLGGVVMGTRPGDLDPSVLIDLLENGSMTVSGIKKILYTKSGMIGVSGVSSDIRDIEKAALEGNERAELALQLVADSVRNFIGAYAVKMGRLDAVVFTAGIGENSIILRERICRGLDIIGANLDRERNNVQGKQAVISRDGSRVPLLVIPTDEELMIAMETIRVLAGN